MPERVLDWLFPVLVDVVGDKLIDHRIHGGSVLFDSGAELFVFFRVYPDLQTLLFVKVFPLGAVLIIAHYDHSFLIPQILRL